MASISLPRPQRPSTRPSSSSTLTSRSLGRKASILSFKSDKDKPYTSKEDHPLLTHPYSTSPTHQSNNNDGRTPSSFKSNGRIDEPRKSRKHQSKPSVKSITSLKEGPRPKERKGKEKELKPSEGAYHFTDLQHDAIMYGNGGATPESRTRFRSSTTPSQYDWREYSHMPYFRDSGSSSLTHFETPPHTPIDELLSLRGSLERISVVAPVSGVEVMDAMVDGMNGFGADDRFAGRSSMSGRSSKAERAGFHPLYHPPLPTPPPGVTLGGGIARKVSEPSLKDSDEDSDESKPRPRPLPRQHEKRKGRRPQSSSRSDSNNVLTRTPQRPADIQFPTVIPSIDEIIHNHTPESKSKQRIPSISEIIRSHGSKQTSQTSKSSRQVSLDDDEPIMEPLTAEEEAQLLSRSSVDSVAEEVLNAINHHSIPPPAARTLQRARSFAHRQSVYSESVADMSIRSPRSDDHSTSSFSVTSSEPIQLPTFDFLNVANVRPPSASQAIAQYLRSARLTTLLKLTCAPHASRDHPLTVSLSDLGSPTGFPLVVFLGLGCVRHVMGLYDEMAECLGLRLITIDRWGLGRTQTPQSKLARGIPEWSSVVAEVLDRLGIDMCSIMAHSAGAPYALAFANQYPDRIRGDVCLLAPWIGEGAGYKWLKYVPNGILKTAQAADWRIQAWMLGKPPTISYEGIGYDMQAPLSSTIGHGSHLPHTPSGLSPTSGNQDESLPRPSTDSGIFSDYDDLRDFDGRFESRSTVGRSMESTRPRHLSESKNSIHWTGGKRPSKGLLGKLKGSNSQPPSPAPDKSSPSGPGRRLKALRSMGSLKSKASSAPSTISKIPPPSVPRLPQPTGIEIGLGLDEIKWGSSRTSSPVMKSRTTDNSSESPPSSFPRSNGSRSMSFGAYKSPPSSFPSSPMASSAPPTPVDVMGGSYQTMLGNALIAASHSESAKGTHGDLVQILNHDRVPWGFSYSDYPHSVRVWYGDKDEKIAESAVRWLERTMGPDRCHVSVVKGSDHGLMYKSAVVIDVFEHVHSYLEGE